MEIIKQVELTNRALKDLEKISKFNAELFNSEKAKEIAHKIIEETKVLENHNFKELGLVDDFFNYLKLEYRKIFYANYKITYREGKTKIYIVRIFDMRQHPNKNK